MEYAMIRYYHYRLVVCSIMAISSLRIFDCGLRNVDFDNEDKLINYILITQNY